MLTENTIPGARKNPLHPEPSPSYTPGMGGVIQFPKHRTRLSFCDLLTDGCLAFDDECVRTVPTPRKPPVPRVPPPRVPPEPKPRVQPDPSRPTTTPSRRRRTKRTLFAHPRLIIEVQISLRTSADGIGVSGTSNDYDAFGTLIHQTGSTDNPYLFTGERYDAALGLYHLRARYLEPGRSRFMSMDSFEGNRQDPLSLHKYAYANGNPVSNTDPTGLFGISQALTTSVMASNLVMGAWWNPFSWGRKAKIGSFDINGAPDWVSTMASGWMAARAIFKLTLSQGTLADVKIKQWFRGEAYRTIGGAKSHYALAIGGTVMNQSAWTEDGPGFWWNGAVWRNQANFPALLTNPIYAPLVPNGNASSTTATWGDAPEIVATAGEYPIYYGGHGGGGGPFSFGMVIYDASGTKKLAEKHWGIEVRYNSPADPAGVRNIIYASPTTIY